MRKKIIHIRDKCIGCAVCESIAPSTWKVSQQDGRADLVVSQDTGVIQTADVDDATLDENIMARDNCPTGAIRID